MSNKFFKKKFEFLTLKEVLKITDSKLESESKIDLEQKITGINTIQSASISEISFLSSGSYLKELTTSKAGFCFMKEDILAKKPDNILALINKNPYFAYAQLLNYFYEENKTVITEEIAPTAVVSKNAKIGKNVIIMAGAYIGDKVEIGDNSFIGVNSVINDGVVIGNNAKISNLVNISHSKIGNNAIIHSGVKIGQDGFGFVHDKGINHKILQIGMVIIGDDVEIGANSCIDRGAIEDTVISDQVKLDNFVQIAHNVQIGQGTVMAGASCVAGSAKVGRFCQIGGNASVNGHIEIGDGAKIAGASGVVKSVDAMQSVGGYPALPIRDWHRITLKLLGLIKKK